mmetsp:Transcript_4466/g.14893  ORF Transcript_4466/g.14893 Transcript_4466/m.14893 type:complete len:208 (-) Transcript_4466:117-740(-)
MLDRTWYTTLPTIVSMAIGPKFRLSGASVAGLSATTQALFLGSWNVLVSVFSFSGRTDSSKSPASAATLRINTTCSCSLFATVSGCMNATTSPTRAGRGKNQRPPTRAYVPGIVPACRSGRRINMVKFVWFFVSSEVAFANLGAQDNSGAMASPRNSICEHMGWSRTCSLMRRISSIAGMSPSFFPSSPNASRNPKGMVCCVAFSKM